MEVGQDSNPSRGEFWDTPRRTVSGMMSQARLMVEAHLLNEEECVLWCAEKGLVGSATCPEDGNERALRRYGSTCGLRWYCSGCKTKRSVLGGSVFDSLKLAPGRAVMLIHRFAWGATYEDTQLSTQLTAEHTQLGSATVADWFSYLRDRLIDWAGSQEGGRVGGMHQIVQIDEALIGRRKYNRGRVVPGTWVVGLIDESGQLRLTVTADRSAASLLEICRKHVVPGSEIHSDGWRGYSGLKELGYTHRVVNHCEEFVAGDGTHTQRIESQWRNLRRKFSRGGIPHPNIAEHLVEHVWRRNCRINNLDPFLELLKILKCEP